MAGGKRQLKGFQRAHQVPIGDDRLNRSSPRHGIDLNFVKSRKIDKHSTFAQWRPAPRMSTAAHGDFEPPLGCELYRLDHVMVARDLNDDVRIAFRAKL